MRKGGGTLKLIDIPYSQRQSLSIGSKNRFTGLLCEMEHHRLLHCVPQLLLSTLRESCFWVLGERNIFRKITRTLRGVLEQSMYLWDI